MSSHGHGHRKHILSPSSGFLRKRTNTQTALNQTRNVAVCCMNVCIPLLSDMAIRGRGRVHSLRFHLALTFHSLLHNKVKVFLWSTQILSPRAPESWTIFLVGEQMLDFFCDLILLSQRKKRRFHRIMSYSNGKNLCL